MGENCAYLLVTRTTNTPGSWESEALAGHSAAHGVKHLKLFKSDSHVTPQYAVKVTAVILPVYLTLCQEALSTRFIYDAIRYRDP
jgi:hypothetical protein